MKAMKMLIAGLVLAVAGMATAAMNTVLTFSTVGPDRYANGDEVVDGESYALVWTADIAGFTLSDDGTATGGKVVLVVPVAEGGRCPPVKLNIKASVAPQYEGGVWGVYLFDTRSGSVNGVKLIPSATVEVASEGYLVRKTTKSRALLGSSAGVDDAESLVAAVAAGGEVTLNANITLEDELVVSNEVTLNLGGYKITAASGKNAIQVAAGGSLTINAGENGGVSASGNLAVYADYEVSPGAKTVVINGGTYTGNLQFNKYPIQTTEVQSGEDKIPTVVTITDGVFEGIVKIYRCPTTITGGTFYNGLDTRVGSITVYSNSRTPLRITGGTFKTEPINVGSRVRVAEGYYEGGWFKVGDTSVCEAKRNGKFYRYATEAFATVGADTRIEILDPEAVAGIAVMIGEGQSLTVPSAFDAVAAASGLILETTANTADGTVTYTACVSGKVAKIGANYYDTLDEAFGAAQDGDTVMLVADATLGITALSANVTLALAEHSVAVATTEIDLSSGKLTVTGAGFVSGIPALKGKSNLVIAGGTWAVDPSKYVTEVVTALPNEPSDANWRKDRFYVFRSEAIVDGEWGTAPGVWTVVPLPRAYVTPMAEVEKPVIGAYGPLDCGYTFESFNSKNGDDAIADIYLSTGDFSAYSDPVQLARAKELLMEKLPFLGWVADFVVSVDRDVAVNDLALSGYYDEWGYWVTYESTTAVPVGQKIRLLTDVGKATPGDWPYANICQYVRTFKCGANMINSAMEGATMTVQLRLYKPDEDVGLGSPSILICEYKYTFGGKAAKIVREEVPTTYDTLAAAIDDAVSGETIVLLNDFSGDIDLGACEKAFTVAVNGFGCAANVTEVHEGWAVKELSNRNLSYYKIPVAVEENKTAAMVEVVQDNGETVSLAPVTIDETSEFYEEILAETQGTQTTVEEVLAKTDDNGLQKWQNYILQQDPETPVRVNEKTPEPSGDPQPETTVVNVENTLAERTMIPEDCGFKVTYQLDEVSSEGKVVKEGDSHDSPDDDFPIDLEEVTSGDDNHAYFKLSAVIESVDGTGAKTKVQSENTIGVLKVDVVTKNTPVAVPWSSLAQDGEAITVDKLVRTATLSAGDTLTAYDNATGKYKSWELQDDGSWEPVQVIGGSSETTEAGDFDVPRGSAVWVTRENPSQPLYLVGGATDEAAETPLEPAPSEEKKSWNLVGSPSVESVDVNDLLGEGGSVDSIMVPTDGAPKNYIYRDGKWGYETTEYVYDGEEIVGVMSVFKTDDTMIPAGTGFWYLNGSTESGKTVEW